MPRPWLRQEIGFASCSNRCFGSRISGDVFREDLDRDLVLPLRVRRLIHLPHAAFADLGGDLIRAEAGAGSQGHVTRIIRAERGLCGDRSSYTA